MTVPRLVPPPSSARERARDAWTTFWQEPGQSRCIASAVDISSLIDQHWATFAPPLPADARVLDLGCGAGAVGRIVLAARRDLSVTGIDYAKIPLTLQPRLELLSDVAMESLPFADESFAAITSQFGFEYAQTAPAAAEMVRVLARGAPFSFLVHHAGSSIVAADRARLSALRVFLDEPMRDAFCAGDASFTARMTALRRAHAYDSLIGDLTDALPARLARPPRERQAIWTAVEDALAPELCLAKALIACCVAPPNLDQWAAPLRASCALAPVSILSEPNGPPLAWRIEGVRA